MEKFDEGFLDTYSDDFFEYFDKHKILNLSNKKEYREINQEICNLKERYPNVIKFLEEKENVELSKEEQIAILEIFELLGELDVIELKESFKLGLKEAFIYFKSMNMLKV